MALNTFTTGARRTAFCALAILTLASAFAEAAPAQSSLDTGTWKVNMARSKFSAAANTLVLKRVKGNAQAAGANGSANANSFLVISDGKIYVATAASASNASSDGGIKKIDYTRWRDMNVVQIGDKVRSADHCGFRCQSGLADNRMTLTFTPMGNGGAQQFASGAMVFDKR